MCSVQRALVVQDTQDTAYKDIYKATFLMESGIMIESTMHEIILFLNSARETVPSSLFYQTRVFQFEKKEKYVLFPRVWKDWIVVFTFLNQLGRCFILAYCSSSPFFDSSLLRAHAGNLPMYSSVGGRRKISAFSA